MEDCKELLIIEVQKNVGLYDKTDPLFKDKFKKVDIWKAIGLRIGISGDDAQRKWTNIRDAFSQYRRKLVQRNKSGSGANNLKPYKYAAQLEFLIPHFKWKDTTSNLPETASQQHSAPDDGEEDDEDDDDNTEESVDFDETEVDETEAESQSSQCSSPAPSTMTAPKSSSTPQSRRKGTKRGNSQDLDRSILEYLHYKKSAPVQEEDDVDKFFASMAEIMRKLPDRVKADVKFRIHHILHQAETEVLYSQPIPASSMGVPTPAPTGIPTMHLDLMGNANEGNYSVPSCTYTTL